jgi:Uncharacterised nucleotidyltransferase
MSSSEDQLCLLLARGELPPDMQEQARALLAAPLRWDLVLECAMAHEVYPLLYRNLRSLAFAGVPTQARTELETLYKVNAFRNIHLAEELARVLTLLGGAGIPTIPLKGVTLAEALYGDLTMRVCADLDILIPRHAVAQAIGLLLREGYESEFGERFFADLYPVEGIEYDLMRWERGFLYLLEPHYGLLAGPWVDKAALEDLWAESYPQAFLGVAAYALSPEWQILFLVAHAARHRCQGLKWLVDIHDLCSRGGINWETLTAKAKRLGWEDILRFTLSTSHTLFATPIPEELVLTELPSWLKLYPTDPSLHSLQSHLLLLHLLNRPSHKLRYLIQLLLAPTLADRRLCRLPSRVRFLYYLLRPLRLACKWSWRLARTPRPRAEA